MGSHTITLHSLLLDIQSKIFSNYNSVIQIGVALRLRDEQNA